MSPVGHSDAHNAGVMDLIAAAILEIAWHTPSFAIPTQEEEIMAIDPNSININFDPWGADNTPEQDIQALAEQVVTSAARIRSLEFANEVLRGMKDSNHALEQELAAELDAHKEELAVRRFLEDIQKLGLPSIAYENFTKEVRWEIEAALCDISSAANGCLAQYYNLKRIPGYYPEGPDDVAAGFVPQADPDDEVRNADLRYPYGQDKDEDFDFGPEND